MCAHCTRYTHSCATLGPKQRLFRSFPPHIGATTTVMSALSRWAPSRLTTRRLAPECVCPLRHHSLNSIPLQLYINSNIHSFDVILIKFGTDLLCQDAEFYGLRSSTVVFWLCQQRLVGIPFPRAVSSVCVFVCARACCILM